MKIRSWLKKCRKSNAALRAACLLNNKEQTHWNLHTERESRVRTLMTWLIERAMCSGNDCEWSCSMSWLCEKIELILPAWDVLTVRDELIHRRRLDHSFSCQRILAKSSQHATQRLKNSSRRNRRKSECAHDMLSSAQTCSGSTQVRATLEAKEGNLFDSSLYQCILNFFWHSRFTSGFSDSLLTFSLHFWLLIHFWLSRFTSGTLASLLTF